MTKTESKLVDIIVDAISLLEYAHEQDYGKGKVPEVGIEGDTRDILVQIYKIDEVRLEAQARLKRHKKEQAEYD